MNGPILSMRRLAWEIGVPLTRLLAIEADLKRNHRIHYREFPLKTGKDKVRQIQPPREELMDIQRRIVKRILQPRGVAASAHGGVPGRSPSSNAAVHQGQPCVVKIDVKNFFPSVQHRRVYRMFREEFGFGRDVARLLTRLTTLEGALPQGAPTSPAVANLFLSERVDERMGSVLIERSLEYSRFVDDLTISGKDPRPAINEMARLLSARGLSIKKSKVAISRRNQPQEVTGLQVNDARRLTIARKKRDAIRAEIFQLRGCEAPRTELEEMVRSISGKIAHVERFHPGDARRLRRYLEACLEPLGGASVASTRAHGVPAPGDAA
jgi:retron-type reverse transcriptase